MMLAFWHDMKDLKRVTEKKNLLEKKINEIYIGNMNEGLTLREKDMHIYIHK